MSFTHPRSSLDRGLRQVAAGPKTGHRWGRAALTLALLAVASWPLAVPDELRAEASAAGTRAALPPLPTPVTPAGPTPPPPAAATVTAPAPTVQPPADLNDLGAWIAYRQASHRPALVDEARLFYHRGIKAHRAGDMNEASRLLRGAAELDPTFVAPHLTLASWSLTRDPSLALMQYAVVLDLARRSFLVQLGLVANLAFFAMHALFVGLMLTSLLIVVIHQAELRHICRERLSHRFFPGSARVWTWVILLVPFVAGFGVALPAVVLMGMLWPMLRVRERLVFAAMALALAAAPFSGHVLGRLATPLRDDRAPFYGVTALAEESWTPARQATLDGLAARLPDDPFVRFGQAWMSRLGGDLDAAERGYRRVLAAWPGDARVLNNLANVLAARGQDDGAIELYRAAIAADPTNAAAPYNLSLVYTRHFEYRAATEAAARASALDFEMVKAQQALGTDDGVMPTVDQWLAPATCWTALLQPDVTGATDIALPPAWHGRIETSSPVFGFAALLLAVGSAVLGTRLQHSIPLRSCRNCGRVVCRRCSQRRRELALCPACARQESMAESPEFARVLLARLRQQSERRQRIVRTTLAALIPGYGLLAFHRVFRATLLAVAATLLASPALGVTPPFSFHAWPGLADGALPVAVPIAGWTLVYLYSLLGYFAQAAHEARREQPLVHPGRGRPGASDRITAKAA